MIKKIAEEKAMNMDAKERKNMQHQEQTVRVSNERFSVPEVLFNPSDIGINEAGVPEML